MVVDERRRLWTSGDSEMGATLGPNRRINGLTALWAGPSLLPLPSFFLSPFSFSSSYMLLFCLFLNW
jgi:hypothetical protein